MGHRIGEYELVHRIGSGGMAEVWMGRRALPGGATKSVAIKFMAASMADSERHRKMFLDEARLSMLLSHSNVVQVFDAGLDGQRMYMVMEWVDGLNLSQLVQLAKAAGQPISLSVVGYVIGEVLQGLSYAHELRHEGRQLGIVHRDISPHNVLVSLSGEVKLADFGVARLAVEETTGVNIKGKLRYMAPEHLAGRTKSAKVDLFGVGAILHELLSGDRFRADADEVALYHQILGGHTPELVRTDVPPELVALRLGLLEPDETRRLPSADAALQQLEAWAGYRNAAGELARMCRGFTGVDAPRSGLHVHARVEPDAAPSDTPTATTHTSMVGRAREHTSPTGDAGTPRPHDPSNTWAAASGREPRRGLLLAGVIGGAVVLSIASALGVMAYRKRAQESSSELVAQAPSDPPSDGISRTPEPEPEPPAGPDLAPTVAKANGDATTGTKASGEAPTIEVAAPPREPAADPTAKPVAEPATSTPVEPSTTSTPVEADTPSSPTPRASTGTGTKKPKPAAPTPKVKVAVVFRLKSPLRFAWARIDSGEGFAVEPKATRTVTAGSHTIDWRADDTKPWVSGGRFEIVAGSSATIRIGSSGPHLE